MKMKRTMETVDMKKVYEELKSLNNLTVNAVIATVEDTRVTDEHVMYLKQIHFAKVAEDLLERYKEFDGINAELVDNYTQFIRQALEVHAFGKSLNGRNYVSLLNTISALAYGVQTLKLNELVTSGYWGDLEVEPVNIPNQMGTAMTEG